VGEGLAGPVGGGGPSALVKRGGRGGRTGGEGSVAWGIAHVCSVLTPSRAPTRSHSTTLTHPSTCSESAPTDPKKQKCSEVLLWAPAGKTKLVPPKIDSKILENASLVGDMGPQRSQIFRL